MIASPHLAAGAIVGKVIGKIAIKNLFLSLILSFGFGAIFHFLMDMIPHAEYTGVFKRQFWTVFILDLFSVLSLVYFIGASKPYDNENNYILLAGLIGSALPDIPSLVIKIFKVDWTWLNKLESVNKFFHTSHYIISSSGFYYQLLLSAFLLWLLSFFR